MGHLILLGDSIFDNASYVGNGPAVIDQVRHALPEGWRATLRAVDGDVTGDVHSQLRDLPTDASHLTLSAGGNDALRQAGLLQEEADSVAQVMLKFSAVARDFEHSYERVLRAVVERRLPAAACTIYFPRFSDPSIQALARAGLTFFNDAIIGTVARVGIPLIDLRLTCTEHGDYAIEPSSHRAIEPSSHRAIEPGRSQDRARHSAGRGATRLRGGARGHLLLKRARSNT